MGANWCSNFFVFFLFQTKVTTDGLSGSVSENYDSVLFRKAVDLAMVCQEFSS